jgi:hypothetical protein
MGTASELLGVECPRLAADGLQCRHDKPHLRWRAPAAEPTIGLSSDGLRRLGAIPAEFRHAVSDAGRSMPVGYPAASARRHMPMQCDPGGNIRLCRPLTGGNLWTALSIGVPPWQRHSCPVPLQSDRRTEVGHRLYHSCLRQPWQQSYPAGLMQPMRDFGGTTLSASSLHITGLTF